MINKLVYLHIGFDKTGSSSIQATLSQNVEILEKLDYTYPLADNPLASANQSRQMYSLFSSKPYAFAENIRLGWSKHKVDSANKAYELDLRKALGNKNRVVISGEAISHLDIKGLERCRDYFINKAFRLKVIAFIRNPLDMVQSGTQQRIRSGVPIFTSNMMVVRSRFIKSVKDVFKDSVKFIPFSIACEHKNGVVGSFFEQLEIVDQTPIKFIRANVSLSNQATRLINFINLNEPFIVDGKPNPNRSQKDIEFLSKIPGKKFSLSKQEWIPVFDQVELESEKIIKVLGDEFGSSNLNLEQFQDQNNDCFYDVDNRVVDFLASVLPSLSASGYDLVKKYFDFNPYLSEEIKKKSNFLFRQETIKYYLKDAQTINYLRDAALLVEKTDFKVAYDLMRLAFLGRPNGPFIFKKYKNYYLQLIKLSSKEFYSAII